MIPIVTPEEMGAIDAAAPEPVAVLIERAGAAVARAALHLLGGAYGRRVVVLAGRGNNGNDGRSAAQRLERRGVRCTVVDAADAPATLPPADLVIDAAYGTGFRGEFTPPALQGRGPDMTPPVLAVDIPSGITGLTGEAKGRPLPAVATVTFAALKPGLVLHDGPALSGDVRIADIGLDVSRSTAHLVEADDVRAWLPPRPADGHKWQTATWIVAGSPGMTGAAHLAASAAQRTGAGYVRLSSPGVDDDPRRPTEAVGVPLPAKRWARRLLDEDLDRFAALAVGPGLGTGEDAATAIRTVVAEADAVSIVVDGDGLTALGTQASDIISVRGPSAPPVVLTPHDGEAARLLGERPGPDRFAVARDLAARTGAVVLLKGSTTVVADPGGRVLASTTGDARLATAGTGDVLTGTITALLAQGVPALRAAASRRRRGRWRCRGVPARPRRRSSLAARTGGERRRATPARCAHRAPGGMTWRAPPPSRR